MKKREIDITIVRRVNVNILERYFTKMDFIGGACLLQFLDVKNSYRLVVPFAALTLRIITEETRPETRIELMLLRLIFG